MGRANVMDCTPGELRTLAGHVVAQRSAIALLGSRHGGRHRAADLRFGPWRRRHIRNGQLLPHLFEGEAIEGLGAFLRRQLLREIVDHLLEIGIVAREAQRRPVLGERFGELATSMVNLCEAANGGEILGRALEHQHEFTLGIIDLFELEERPAERDMC